LDLFSDLVKIIGWFLRQRVGHVELVLFILFHFKLLLKDDAVQTSDGLNAAAGH
jgi:hypothetical protein